MRGSTSQRERGRGYEERHPHRYRESGRYGHDNIADHEPLMRNGRGHGRYRHQEQHHLSSTFSKTDFGKNLQQLHTTLKDSIRFFRDFEENYLEETDGIKRYATSRVMDELWTAKAVTSDRDPSSRPSQCSPPDKRGSDGQYSNHRQSFRGGKFRDHIQYIREDFENVLSSGPPRPHRKQHHRERMGSIGSVDSVAAARLDADSTARLMGKLAGQYKVLGKILGNIYKVRSYVQEFIKESELLAGYLDKSRNLWQLEEQVQPRQRQREFQQQEREPERERDRATRHQHDEHGYQSDGQDHGFKSDRDSGPYEDSNQKQVDEW